MLVRKLRKDRRWGASAVETALVLIPLTMFLFGVLEFGRLLMNWSILNEAAREGCRYALANNTDTNIQSDAKAKVLAYMGSLNGNFNNGSGVTVNVTGYSLTVSGSTYTYVSVSNVNNLVPGQFIQVQVFGQFNFMDIIPFVHMPPVTLQSNATMVCEGGT